MFRNNRYILFLNTSKYMQEYNILYIRFWNKT